ncbi:MAG: rod shape-determining protein RodA [Candidatus Yanofskybacteria bacterium]|nr:rod shape-determining protein RodA [Candidatus Yanofskybacteria bacterium]
MAPRKSFRNSIRSYFKEIDFPLFAAIAAISLFSILNMYGIGGLGSIFTKQIIFVAIGLIVMVLFSFFNYRYLKNYSFPVLLFYFISIFLLFLTFYSRSVRGVNAWIVLGQFTFEPAELAKLMLIVLMAKYFSQRHVHVNQFRHILISGIYYGVPVLVILAQPDLGSAIIFSLIWISILAAVGINKKHLFLLIALATVVSYGSWMFVLKPYQKDRLSAFINPGNDPRGSGYNLIQSKIAIGSGYWFGNGLGKGSQTTLGFLPESHNDFVFAATAEQFGFVGISLVMAVILFIVYRILAIGRATVSNFGKIFSIGMAAFIFSHALIGASVNIGLMPVTGIPFPFLSYGGSYLISIMTGLGILQSIKRYG